MNRLCFVYGSNLDLEDVNRWCLANDCPPPRVSSVARGWLPDHRLAFDYHSRTRGGGALDVVPDLGNAVSGLLLQPDERTWESLDRKEGHPGWYRRRPVVVLSEDGREHRAETWAVVPARRVEFQPPTPEYRELVLRARISCELPVDGFDAAAENRTHRAVGHVFVYGSLRRGGSRHALLRGLPIEPALLHDAHLLQCGDWPGLRPGPHAPLRADNRRVYGEIVACDDPGVLSRLDRIEGFSGWDSGGRDLFRRALVRIEDRLCWTYRWNAEDPDRPVEEDTQNQGPWVLRDLGRQLADRPRRRRAATRHLPATAHGRVTWGGADLAVFDRPVLDDDPDGQCYRSRVQVLFTPHADALHALLKVLYERLPVCDKYTFTERMAEAVTHYQGKHPVVEDERDLLCAVLAEAWELWEDAGRPPLERDPVAALDEVLAGLRERHFVPVFE